ncbi:LysM peptidoglycan-binding domain-containing protein [Cellulosimicrobium sp. SH8]|uniref:LysM peptidoglycan-binding domain-containing protein n=1 Tax=Cellulosimicrobium sp. SH8 TaxID=2952936 RepID=UPI0021F3210A|nr:LysM peptidoglycan-binding domain-containing protein [Cellulosimicrobium sp. SH8]
MDAMAISAVGPLGRADGAAVPERAGGRPLRLTRRGRVVLVLLAAVVLLLAARVGVAVASGPGEPVEVRVHVVAAGETLWELAQGVAAPGEDLRDVVSGLAELNGLSSSGLQAGQKILLPASA